MAKLMSPYVAECGLSVALEPSTMLLYEADHVIFYMEGEQESEEPKCPELDRHCLDRYQAVPARSRQQMMEEDGKTSQRSSSPLKLQIAGLRSLSPSPPLSQAKSASPSKKAAKIA